MILYLVLDYTRVYPKNWDKTQKKRTFFDSVAGPTKLGAIENEKNGGLKPNIEEEGQYDQ